MQISRLYSNKPNVFTPIDFHCAENSGTLNVVFAEVKNPKDDKKDSHNLGKTTLIHLIEFCLLKYITGTQHFLEKRSDRFKSFVFYLELALHDGGFVTVSRSVANNTNVSLKKHDQCGQDFTSLHEDEWDHHEIPLATAVTLLDSYLDLRLVEPWGYRKGVSYFLRTQNDYRDVFQIQKFVQGKDREWKPYLASIFELDHEAAGKKYEIDQLIEEASGRRKRKEAEILPEYNDRDSLASEIEIKRDELSDVETQLDDFDFSHEERRINRDLVDQVERELADIARKLYTVEVDIEQIDHSLSNGVKFDLGKIKGIFSESEVHFPDALSRSYEDLVEFNKKLTNDRNTSLRSRKRDLLSLRDELENRQDELSAQRSEYHAIIKTADSFKKYKELQKQLAKQRANIAILEGQLSRLDELQEIDLEIRELRKQRDELVHRMEMSLRSENSRKNEVIRLFNRYVRRVLNINGKFVIRQNKEGNFEFNIQTLDRLGQDTSQADGKTYGQLICALFDMAVLKVLEDLPFFHFVYHDGLLEGLDNRKKIAVLELARELIQSGKIQYILSVIDSDLPRDENEHKITFSDDEVILSLNDSGNAGLLFKMPPF
ncbi:DUF2326 domain-containing protein [Oceanicaulis alexandrii]|uniref:DUF2326 domain-containing protein n=1 Tax=Oceanicaulis alexandrii TaxID=153233 RepID=UPI00040DCB12|nr:DUF2326 domain-containing protein [Oceanicaulis alexandrii]